MTFNLVGYFHCPYVVFSSQELCVECPRFYWWHSMLIDGEPISMVRHRGQDVRVLQCMLMEHCLRVVVLVFVDYKFDISHE